MEFKEGDTVQLKSGSPFMVIEKIGTYSTGPVTGIGCVCAWFDEKNKPNRHLFAATALTHVTDEDIPLPEII